MARQENTAVPDITRREIVIDVTLDLIAEKGLAAISTREIARRANVSEALIFHHFGSKVGLLTAAAHSGDTLLAEVMARTNGPPASDLPEAIMEICARAGRKLRPGGPGWAFTTALLSRDQRTEELRQEGMELLRQSEAALASWLERSGPPRHGGSVAARGLYEGILFLAATIPHAPEAWDEAAPPAFADLASRWCAIHLETI